MHFENMQEGFIANQPYQLTDPPLIKGSSFKHTLTNLAYSLKNNSIINLPFSSRTNLHFQGYEKVYLLGSCYDCETKQEFYNSFEKIIWFSYRKLPQCEDVGWGCMIRVVQMLVAQAITKDQPQLHPDTVISLFRDERSGPLSLSRLCKLGNLCPRWTSCPEVLSIMGSALQELKDQGRIKFNFEVFCDQLEIKAIQDYQEEDFPRLITIQTRVGEAATIPKDYVFHLQQLIKDQRFVGMVSGHKSEALYIAGNFQKRAIILDPHYVQETQSFSTFFCKNPQGMEFELLSSSIAVSFYIDSLGDFQDWVGEMLVSKRVSEPYWCFPVKVDEEDRWFHGRRKGSDDFQLL